MGRFTVRQNGKRMTTVYLPYHITEGDVRWVAERKGVSEQVALRLMRNALIETLGSVAQQVSWVVSDSVEWRVTREGDVALDFRRYTAQECRESSA